eukprot:6391768-Amphidinium_carterae.1
MGCVDGILIRIPSFVDPSSVSAEHCSQRVLNKIWEIWDERVDVPSLALHKSGVVGVCVCCLHQSWAATSRAGWQIDNAYMLRRAQEHPL